METTLGEALANRAVVRASSPASSARGTGVRGSLAVRK
jgi:hypothetical protein